MSQLAALTTLTFLVASSAWAQTTAPAPGGTGAPATGGGIGDYWWIILIVVIAALALWYFLRRNRSGV